MNLQASDEPCPHCWMERYSKPAAPQSKIYKDECMHCFTGPKHDDGFFLSMSSFYGYCTSHLLQVIPAKVASGVECLFLRIKQLPLPPKDTTDPMAALLPDPDPEYETDLVCMACNKVFPVGVGNTFELTMSIMAALSPQRQEAVTNNAWGSARPCDHVRGLTQTPDALFKPGNPPRSAERCTQCEHTLNNWLCLTCGHVGCPRAEAGGKQHAIAHYLQSGHAIVLKLGTVTPAGADVHCYACDDEVTDPNLAIHLAHFGVDMRNATKGAKSLAEMELDRSLQHDYNIVTEAGKNLISCWGPEHTGMKNFGNTCYVASVCQVLFALPTFQERFFRSAEAAKHPTTCRADPSACYECQMYKLAEGLLSGRFSVEADEARHGITPRDFKRVMAEQHRDYGTMEQQDAAEYLRHVITVIDRRERLLRPKEKSPVDALAIRTEERTQCMKCQRVRYRENTQHVLSLDLPPPATGTISQPSKSDANSEANRPRCSLDDLFSSFMMPSSVSCRCEGCGQAAEYAVSQRLKSFPDVLAVHVRREYFCRQSLQAKKQDTLIDAPQELSVERLRGTGLQPGEVPFGGEAPAKVMPVTADVDDVALAQMMSVGIDPNIARIALQATSNNFDRAIDWVFSHPEAAEAPQSETPPTQQQGGGSLTDGPSRYALWAIISHVGANATTGHYVAHIRDKDGHWVIFNDEKVALSQDPPIRMASIFFYRRA